MYLDDPFDKSFSACFKDEVLLKQVGEGRAEE